MNEVKFIKEPKITNLIEYKQMRKLRKAKKLLETLNSPELKYPFYTFVSLTLLITIGSVLFFLFYTSKF